MLSFAAVAAFLTGVTVYRIWYILKTYIQISQAARNREAPVLAVIGQDGKQEMVNYRVKDDMYIVDRLFERAELILGSGKKARKVEIDRERKG